MKIFCGKTIWNSLITFTALKRAIFEVDEDTTSQKFSVDTKMNESGRTRKTKADMITFDSRNHPLDIRTTKYRWLTFVLLIVLVQRASAVHINFDDVETSWLKNVAVHVFPIGNVRSSVPSLKITGLASSDLEDGFQIKPTFSTSQCIGNETELQIIDTTFSSVNAELIVSFKNFNFKQHLEAYLCIKTKDDDRFLHMGPNSKFRK